MDPRGQSAVRHSHLALILLSVLVGALLTALILAQTDRSQPVLSPAEAQQQVVTQFESVAERVLPAVVYINSNVTQQADPREEEMRRRLEEMFRGMPGMPGAPGAPRQAPSERQRLAAGSGWIYSPEGHIVTNAHVVRGATKITVQLHDREGDMTEYPATVVGTDPRSELAVIKINPGRRLPTIELGDSDRMRIASWVMAVGSPFQLQQTVTVGVVSARGRTISGESEYFQVGDLIQTDASINPGNSGGPLVDLNGRVIGINVAIASPGATSVPFNIGIGFAIPSNVARVIVPQLITRGRVARGWLGVTIKSLNDNLREYFGVPQGGVLITQVNEGAPAARVLRANDVVVRVNNQPVSSSAELQNAVANTPPGTRVNMDIVRNKQPMQLAVELGEMPARYAGFDEAETTPTTTGTEAVGPPIRVANITPQLARERNLCRVQGVFVDAVPDDLQDRLQPGDVIAKVDGANVLTVDQYNAAVRRALEANQQFVVLTIERIGAGGQIMGDVIDIPLTRPQQ